MEYNKIVAVTGLPGLYELLSSKADGAIVRSLDDKATKFVSNRVHNLSHLETIEVYTTKDNVNLVDVFKAMQDSKQPLPDGKDNGSVKKFFEQVFPDMDFQRVYTSDMKKMVKWYDVLHKNNVELKLTEMPEQEEEPVTAAMEDQPADEKKKPAAKKKATPAEDAVELATAEEPKKKTARKKKTEE
jgi:hypothetical protein